ncbi:MAG: hypothetical protein KF749_11855 [Bacteroidetes bacterium]|nr:hypothetical protein [Bacteroidota bacterium]MCW5894199.1 hypothetical protein [Bacteroidota bacterium]
MAKTSIKAHFDGKQIVLDEAAHLEPGEKVIVRRISAESGNTYSVKETNPAYDSAKSSPPVTKEIIKAEIDMIPDEGLPELLDLIKRMAAQERGRQADSLLLSLQQIEIEGPKDFSTNLDAYLNGEKELP